MGKMKALLRLDGETALEKAIRLFKHAAIEDIVVVTGYRFEELTGIIKTTLGTRRF